MIPFKSEKIIPKQKNAAQRKGKMQVPEAGGQRSLMHSIQHRAPSLGLPHPKNSLQDMVLPPKQGAGAAIPSVGCTHVIWLKGNAPNTSQEPLQQEKPHHCNSHFPFPSQFCSHQHHTTVGQRDLCTTSTQLSPAHHYTRNQNATFPEKQDIAPM